MRRLVLAGGFAILCGMAATPDAMAFPAAAPVMGQDAATPFETVQVGPGYYRNRLYRKRMRHYRNNPGARYELYQQRRRHCRVAPSRC